MASRYLPFVDWMKFAGIVLIVAGHVAARPINHLTAPVYPKQLGVAFFLFVLGFALANERRPRGRIVFGRLFDMYLYALPLALLISALAPIRHTLNASNYLPFVLGANVLVNNFPANPTTWFVGTYLHILVLWALLVRFPVRGWMIAASFAFETLMRAGLSVAAGGYVAYMSFFNWSTVFLFGLWCGARRSADARSSPWPHLALLAAVAAAWATVMPPHVQAWTFPFATLSGALASPLWTSALASAAYLSFTALLFEASRRLDAPAVVRFFARNTLIVFLAHMPVFYLLEWLLRPYGLAYVWMATINLAVCLAGLAAASEAIARLTRVRDLRKRVVERVFQRQAIAGAAVSRVGV